MVSCEGVSLLIATARVLFWGFWIPGVGKRSLAGLYSGQCSLVTR